MLRTIDRLTMHVDLPLMIVAVLIGIIGFLSCLVFASRLIERERPLGWGALLALILALTFWSTHFIALLGHHAVAIDRYALTPALLSLLAGAIVIGAGVAIATRWQDVPGGRLAGGATVGLGVLAMHQVGRLVPYAAGSPPPSWSLPDLSAPFTLTGPVLGMLAISMLFGSQRGVQRLASVIGLMTLAVVAHLYGPGTHPAVPGAGSSSPFSVAGLPSIGLPGELFAVLVALMALKVLLGAGAAVMIESRWARQLSYQARHDALTGLPNRRRFREVAARRLGRAAATGATPVLVTLDLDDFKPVNDVHGHLAGDRLVNRIAQRIAAIVGDEDTPARMGGDEFTVLLHDVDRAGATAIASRLQEAVSAPVRLHDVSVQVGASIGMARYPNDGADIDALLHNADTAMYHAKSRGKGMSVFFEPSMHERLAMRIRLESGLHRALRARNLHLHYQPLVTCEKRRTVCMEALLRWHDAELGDVGPDDFIPVAESSGLIVSIGDFVLEQACRDAVAWPEAVCVAVNLSAVQFRRGDLVASVQRALDRSGLPGHCLELEITESLLLEDDTATRRTIEALRTFGVRIVMDDFGTGYSSFNYLQRFGFDKVKIDRSFVAAIEEPDSRAIDIIGAAISMGRNLGMRVVAEGVETDAQAALLTELDCDELQGFLIAHPMPNAGVDEFLIGRTGQPAAPPVGHAATALVQ